jgi:hypothetical protein
MILAYHRGTREKLKKKICQDNKPLGCDSKPEYKTGMLITQLVA